MQRNSLYAGVFETYTHFGFGLEDQENILRTPSHSLERRTVCDGGLERKHSRTCRQKLARSIPRTRSARRPPRKADATRGQLNLFTLCSRGPRGDWLGFDPPHQYLLRGLSAWNTVQHWLGIVVHFLCLQHSTACCVGRESQLKGWPLQRAAGGTGRNASRSHISYIPVEMDDMT